MNDKSEINLGRQLMPAHTCTLPHTHSRSHSLAHTTHTHIHTHEHTRTHALTHLVPILSPPSPAALLRPLPPARPAPAALLAPDSGPPFDLDHCMCTRLVWKPRLEAEDE